MTILNNQPARSGNMVASDGTTYNLVDILVALISATPVDYDEEAAQDILNRTTPLSGNMVASDGKVYNVVDVLKALSIFPEYPEEDGTYVLTCTMNSGEATLSWESTT